MGVQVQKYLGDVAKVGYRWTFSPDPKATYWWASVRFVYGSFLRFVRYSDGSIATSLRFLQNFGSPYLKLP